MAIIENKAIEIINSTGQSKIDPSTIQMIITLLYYIVKAILIIYSSDKIDKRLNHMGPVCRVVVRSVCKHNNASEWAEPIINSLKNTPQNECGDLIRALADVE